MPAEPAFGDWLARVEAGLAHALQTPPDGPTRLHEAMRHAVLGGGKRLRPLLVHASGHLLGARPESLDAPAVAVELVHAYSLVHDDLPAMDDDALRRGQPTVHIAFDEATAILAGDALQTLAFEVLAGAPLDAATRIALVASLAGASGAAGMCGGQALDLAATGQRQPLQALERMHALKTGALIRAAVRMGALCAQADEADLAALFRQFDFHHAAFRVHVVVPGEAEAMRRFPDRHDMFAVEGAFIFLESLRRGPGMGAEI